MTLGGQERERAATADLDVVRMGTDDYNVEWLRQLRIVHDRLVHSRPGTFGLVRLASWRP